MQQEAFLTFWVNKIAANAKSRLQRKVFLTLKDLIEFLTIEVNSFKILFLPDFLHWGDKGRPHSGCRIGKRYEYSDLRNRKRINRINFRRNRLDDIWRTFEHRKHSQWSGLEKLRRMLRLLQTEVRHIESQTIRARNWS